MDTNSIQKIAEKYHLKLVYLFGSKARKRDSKISDTDIAVLLYENYDYELNKLILDLIFEFSQIFHTDDVDLLILNSAPLALQYNVIVDGNVLYKSTIEDKCLYETKVIKLYLDFKRYEEEYYKNMHKHICQDL